MHPFTLPGPLGPPPDRHHVAWTINSTSVGGTPGWRQVLYLDGAAALGAKAESFTPSPLLAAPAPTGYTELRVGQSGDGARLFNGYVNDLRVWDRALTAAEVARVYTA